MYRAFHGFEQPKFACGGLVLGYSYFSLLPQLPQKMTIDSTVLKIATKITISLFLNIFFGAPHLATCIFFLFKYCIE